MGGEIADERIDHFSGEGGDRFRQRAARRTFLGLFDSERMMLWQRDLTQGQRYPFGDWSNIRPNLPPKSGVYTIWDQEDRFIYVGRASKKRGLGGRLGDHASGARGNDQFNVYVADRLVLPQLTLSQLCEIAAGTLSFDGLVKAYTRERLAFRVHATATDADAKWIEEEIQKGQWLGGKPLFNPRP